MSLELQDIFERFGVDYRKNHALPLNQLKTMNAIQSCRTSNLGGHVDVCDACGHERISYNSCRNRHCPKCQGLAKEQWLLDRERDLLEIGYFHVVFTVPNSLNPLALQNQKVFYSFLFKAASETLLELSRDPKYLGAEIGFISVLHTWGQNLMVLSEHSSSNNVRTTSIQKYYGPGKSSSCPLYCPRWGIVLRRNPLDILSGEVLYPG